MTKLTSIVTVIGGVVHSVRTCAVWMTDESIDAYLDGLELAKEGTNIVFNRITMCSDFGETDGGWVSAHRRNGRWDLAVGA